MKKKYFDLKGFRKANGIRQQELADYLGVGQSFISQIERGERTCPVEWIGRFAANAKWTMLEEEPVEETPIADTYNNIAEESEVLSLRREVQLLREQIEELRSTNEKCWEMIRNLSKCHSEGHSVTPPSLSQSVENINN